MLPKEWIRLLLKRHQLERPDGRPLYQYRVTDDEFSDLEQLLIKTAVFGIENITRMTQWDAAFVIYGSEWWRRSYDGGWGWDGIFNFLEIDNSYLSPSDRSSFVENGLRRWGREVRKYDGVRKFLGTVATEGGLPLKQLSGSGGWLKGTLQPVLRKHVSKGISIDLLLDGYKGLIPRSYRSVEMMQILSDIIETIVNLRKAHDLTGKESPVQWLDANQPNWRDSFPLPIDDEAGRSLLKDLIEVASKTKKNKDAKNPIEIERFLIHVDTGSPQLVAQIEFPKFVYFESFGFDELPSTLSLEIVEPNGAVWPLCRAIQTNYGDKKALRLSGKILNIRGLDAAKELILRFKSIGGVIKDLPLVNGAALETQVPWLFKIVDDKWLVHGVSSQAIKDDTALAYIPGSCSVKPENEEAIISSSGDLFDGSVIKFSGHILCDSEDANFKLSAGSSESVIQYHLSGERLPYASNPSEIFIGPPNLIEVDTVTEISKVNHTARLVARPLGVDEAWQTANNLNTGYYDVRLLDESNNILLRKRVGILNSDFQVKIRPDKVQVSSGVIQLEGIGNCDVNVSQHEAFRSQVVNNKATVDIKLDTKSAPPLSVNISLLPKGHPQDLSLTLPFPSQGAQLFNDKGQTVPLSSPLFLNDLKGYRFKIYSDNFHTKAQLRFSLIDSYNEKEDLRDIYIQKKISLTSEHTEFAINNWMPFIDSLISVSPSLDAKVKVSLTLSGQREYGFLVGRYENELRPNFVDGVVELKSTEFSNIGFETSRNISVSVICLNQPEQSFLDLCTENSEDTSTGRWLFNPEKRDHGPWIIYPSHDSSLQFRPLLWNVGDSDDSEDISEIDSLPKSIRIYEPVLREQAIRQVLKLMVSDQKHKSWGFLKNLWEKTSHLPLGTFDLWKIIISEYSFLACLFLKDRDDIIHKLANELPLIWELIPLHTWEKALLNYKENLISTLDDDELEYVEIFLGKKIDKIERDIELTATANILRLKMLKVKSVTSDVSQLILKLILDGEYQQLLRRQSISEENWPELLKSKVTTSFFNLPESYISIFGEHNRVREDEGASRGITYRDSVVYLPILLAWEATSDKTSDSWLQTSSDLFKVKQLISFDEEWFDSVYSYMLGWFSQQENI